MKNRVNKNEYKNLNVRRLSIGSMNMRQQIFMFNKN